MENFLRPLSVVDFIGDDAAAYARVREKLERAKTPVGSLDVLIAAQAVARKLVLVSTNEFGRIGGLKFTLAPWLSVLCAGRASAPVRMVNG